MTVLKRLLCRHEYKICTFNDTSTGESLSFPCTDIGGNTLVECKKCGKQKITHWLRNPTGRNPNPYCDEESCVPDGGFMCVGCPHNHYNGGD